MQITSLQAKPHIPFSYYCTRCRQLRQRTVSIRGLYGEVLYRLCYSCAFKGVWIEMPEALKTPRWSKGKFSQERIKLGMPTYQHEIEVID